MVVARVILAVALAYLIGGIPWALIIGKRLYGIDVRTEGSGNLGATNVYRVLGTKAGLATAVLDVAKGAAAVALAWLIVPPSLSTTAHEWALIGATMAAILGHSYSPYIHFTGGKGVAVAAGALLVLTPKVWPIMLLTFALVVVATRYVSLASILTALEYPVLTWYFYGSETPVLAFSFAAAAVVIWRHRSNIRRLLRGQETKIALKRPTSASGRREER